MEKIENLSFTETLSRPIELLDPFSCKKKMCIRTINNTTNGNKKCRQKKRLTVTFVTLAPPQIKVTILGPNTGISLNKFVITDAPQKDIWFIGITYPKKATAMTETNKTQPVNQVFFLRKDL